MSVRSDTAPWVSCRSFSSSPGLSSRLKASSIPSACLASSTDSWAAAIILSFRPVKALPKAPPTPNFTTSFRELVRLLVSFPTAFSWFLCSERMVFSSAIFFVCLTYSSLPMVMSFCSRWSFFISFEMALTVLGISFPSIQIFSDAFRFLSAIYLLLYFAMPKLQ